ncbi:uncharacterized protein PFL1_02275 [Pseudozyma flocculosa PF-1]|uniref:Uncharacterized protein n=1 Tax=Pseudozyma flocculosa TaxID=84751 RepID=A0A5C3F5X2_9BASI|nr:uncharacterized protein PFL1_02275 [Pseudozyma flocculosa PF-1]EPQ30159.1 hypothetical protein PFL1_02275 [Pseudozyma flocculosa PF-1]SPO39914.1 uncharacterized protein PSFLO_05395 [Pseudozyma flocculosa]
MARTTQAPRLACAVLLLAATAGVSALPTTDAEGGTHWIQKRAIMRGKDFVPLGKTNIPLTPLLLIFCALGFSVLALLYALINLFCTSRLSRSSRQINEERSRAKQDLRVRGASRSALSPGGSPTPGSSSSLDSAGRKLPPNKVPKRVGGGSVLPRIGGLDRRQSRGYRGTSFSLADAGKRSSKAKVGTLGLPVLATDGLSSGSSFQISPNDLETGEASRSPLSIVAGKRASSLAVQGRGLSNGSSVSGSSGASSSTGVAGGSGSGAVVGGRPPGFGTRHIYRTSSSVGLGADLFKSRNSVIGSIPVNPSAMDRTYATAEYGHPLDHSHDLRRHITDPTGVPLSNSRRNSSYSLYDNTSSEAHSFNDSMANSRMGSFSLATSKPLQPLSSPQFGHGSMGSLAGQLGSGASSPRQTGYATPIGGPSSAMGVSDSSYMPRNKSYDSDEGDAITAQSRLLSSSGKTYKSPARI